MMFLQHKSCSYNRKRDKLQKYQGIQSFLQGYYHLLNLVDKWFVFIIFCPLCLHLIFKFSFWQAVGK